MSRIRQFAKRALVPTVAVTVLESDFTTRVRATVNRALGRQISAEFYFAFDCPYSALAFGDVIELAETRGLELTLFPVIDRGIPSDPLAATRRSYAVVDATRLARYRGRPLGRRQPVETAQVTDIAAWAEAARERGGLVEFSRRVLGRIWEGDERLPDFGELYALYDRACRSLPPKNLIKYKARLRRNTQRLRERGHWEAPSMLVEGKWFFAHERMDQIGYYLDELGALGK